MLHEARTEIAWQAKRFELHEESLIEVEGWYRATGPPALIAGCERVRSEP